MRPMIWSYDIGNCFNYTERKDFSFKLSGKRRHVCLYVCLSLNDYVYLRNIKIFFCFRGGIKKPCHTV